MIWNFLQLYSEWGFHILNWRYHLKICRVAIMTWLPVTDYQWHVFHLSQCHSSFLSWHITGFCNRINMRAERVKQSCLPFHRTWGYLWLLMRLVVPNHWFSMWCFMQHCSSFCTFYFWSLFFFVLRFAVSASNLT